MKAGRQGGLASQFCAFRSVAPRLEGTVNSMPVRSVPVASLCMGSEDVRRVAMGSMAVGLVPVSSDAMASVSRGSVAMGLVSVDSVAMASVSRCSVAMGYVPMYSVPLASMPRGSVPMGSMPVPGGSLAVYPVSSPLEVWRSMLGLEAEVLEHLQELVYRLGRLEGRHRDAQRSVPDVEAPVPQEVDQGHEELRRQVDEDSAEPVPCQLLLAAEHFGQQCAGHLT